MSRPRFVVDDKHGTAYLSLKRNIAPGEAVNTQRIDTPYGFIVLDRDKDDRLLGIEIIGWDGDATR